MNLVNCHSCRRVYQIGGNLDEVNNFLRGQVFPCITTSCSGSLKPCTLLEVVGTDFRFEEIPFKSFFRAVHGFGRVDGKSAELKEAVELLKSRRIVDVRAEPVGQPERVILRELILDDGTVLHFDSSTKGACLYFIERKGPTCTEVVDHE